MTTTEALDHGRFAALILTHGRADAVLTTKAMRSHGFTGRIVYVIDNEDAQGDRYRARFGADDVVEFDKAAIAETFDEADTTGDRRSIVYARNASRPTPADLRLYHFLPRDVDHPWVPDPLL